MTTYTATYSPEDNKIRLYASTRLDAETYARVKDAGFIWAPKQELFFAPKWTPAREDLATELAGEIEPEEMTLAERAAAKAERLETLANRKNRESESLHARADDLSQAFYMGQPILIGHHSERKARKTQERMNAATRKAIDAGKAANHWLYKAESVERFANFKNDPRVRAGRIKTLLAELRDLQRGFNDAHKARELWQKFETAEQITWAIGNLDSRSLFVAWEASNRIRKGETTAEQVKADCLAAIDRAIEGPIRRRWLEHVLNRLAYERALMGPVARFTGTLTPVILQAFAREHGAEKPAARLCDDGAWLLESPVNLPAHIANGPSLELMADEWCDLMRACGYEVPAPVARRVNPNRAAPMPLINPTLAQAEQLQRIWNLHMVAECATRRHAEAIPAAVRSITQAHYSKNSGGSYSAFDTIEIDANGKRVRLQWHEFKQVRTGEAVARIRMCGAGRSYTACQVIHISDKPAKALPIDLDAIESAAAAAIEAGQAAA